VYCKGITSRVSRILHS